jgi:hypothetical protein
MQNQVLAEMVRWKRRLLGVSRQTGKRANGEAENDL